MTQWIITSSLLILAVLLIRVLGRDRLGARLRYALWGLVLLRLLIPVSIGESVLSVQNYLPDDTVQVQTSETYQPSETIQTGGTIQMPQPSVVTGEETHYVNYSMLIWVIGMVIVGGVFLVSNLRFGARLRRSRREIMRRFVPVYESAAVETPCLFGFPCPAVYVTPAVVGDNLALRHVLAHELTHYRHMDHLWSLLRCVCVTLHWYNPLVWVAAIISQKDAELACDEGTLLQLGDHERTAYAKTLLDLTCVGYRGVLTTATSMTGSEGDLKTRVLRIVKNPKMPVAAGIAVLVIAAVIAVSVFTGAMSPKIEGVWRLEMSYLGGETDEPASAYMEYEFYDGRGIRTDHIGSELRSAEWFSYTVDGENISIWFDADDAAMEYSFVIEDDTLTLSQPNREMTMNRVEYESLPFFAEGLISIQDVFESMDGKSLDLTNVESAQLVHLLRSGEVTVMKDYAKNGIESGDYLYYINFGQGSLCIAEGVITTDRSTSDDGYALSNMDEILAWLEAREWKNISDRSFNGLEIHGEPMSAAVNITWGMPRNEYIVPADQDTWRDAVDAARAAGIPDGSNQTIIERMSFGLYVDGQHWYFDTDGTAYIAGAELYIAPADTDTIMQLMQPYVDILSPDTGKTLPYAGTTHYVVRDGLDSSALRFVDGDMMEKLGTAIREGMGELQSGERGIEYDNCTYKLFSNRLGIDGDEIMISDRGELVIDWDKHCDLSNSGEVLTLLGELFAAENSATPEEKLIDFLETELHYAADYPITVELLSKAEYNGRQFALVGVQNDTYADFLVEYTEAFNNFHLVARDSNGGTVPEIAGYWPMYAVFNGTNLCWSVIPDERTATSPDGTQILDGWADNDYTAIRFKMADGSTIDAPVPDGSGKRLMLQMFKGEWPVSSVPMAGNVEITPFELTFDYATTGYPAGSLGEVIDESDLEAAVRLAKSDYEAWKDEEWCLSMEVLDATVNESESMRFREMYENTREGWDQAFMTENFVAVTVTYDCVLDHNKTFIPDGRISQTVLLVRSGTNAEWEIFDYAY